MTETVDHRPPAPHDHATCTCCQGLHASQAANRRLHHQTRTLQRSLLRAKRNARRHKWIIHGSLLLSILISLMVEGWKSADMLFFALAVVTEVTP